MKKSMRVLENKTSAQLKKWNKICLGVAILVLLLMIALLGVLLLQLSNDTEKSWILALGPSVLLPIQFVPIIFSVLISMELKKRN